MGVRGGSRAQRIRAGRQIIAQRTLRDRVAPGEAHRRVEVGPASIDLTTVQALTEFVPRAVGFGGRGSGASILTWRAAMSATACAAVAGG